MGYDRHQRAAIRTAAASVVRQLTELTGTEPRVTAEREAVRIETDVTDTALMQWTRLLAVLELGAEYGVIRTSGGQIAWLRIA
ncbi:hypothetical protein [Streptomyces sp. NPDC090080]|uniref:hypothetical protein n=1 Tax=Streptomyces sp. NPDC090080 TaxID=3365939 RepID=UPI00382F5F15